MSFYSAMPAPKPGPVEGSARPSGAPNNGDMGGRPPTPPPPGSASPMEVMAGSDGGSFYPSTAPPMTADTVPPPSGGTVPPSSPAPAGQPSSGVTININSGQPAGGGQPATPTSQPQPSTPPSGNPAPPGQAASPSAPPSAGGEMWPDLAPPAPVEFRSMPSADQLALVKEGAEVRTPYGVGTKKAGQVARYNLTPAGQEAHKRATLRLRERFGATPFDNDGGPEIPVQLGGWNFNPWSGPGREWSR